MFTVERCNRENFMTSTLLWFMRNLEESMAAMITNISHNHGKYKILHALATIPSKSFEELLGADAGARIHRQLHLANLLVDFLHEIYHKVDELMFEHLLRVEIGNQKADMVSIDRFPPQYDKILRSHHHKSHELFTQYFFDLVRLLDHNANSYRVD